MIVLLKCFLFKRKEYKKPMIREIRFKLIKEILIIALALVFVNAFTLGFFLNKKEILDIFLIEISTHLFIYFILFIIGITTYVILCIKPLKKMITGISDLYYFDKPQFTIIKENENIINQLSNIKASIETKQLQVSKMKIIENDLVQEFRHKTNQFEELKKSHIVMKNKDLYLTAFFENIANNSDNYIWIMDLDGKLIYTNEILEEMLVARGISIKNGNINDFLEGFDTDLNVLLKKDYKGIKFKFKNHIFNESLDGRSVRIKEFGRIKAILCACEKSNFEEKMYHQYLKKSRDLHFINEIGRIVSKNNSIDGTLQEVLDKVSFLTNFNCSIRLINDENRLELKTNSGYTEKYIVTNSISIEDTHMGMAFKENKIILINSIEDLSFKDFPLQEILNEGMSIAYIPLSNHEKTFGVMNVISTVKFNNDMLVLLESIAINITITLEKVLLYERLKSNYFKTVEAFVTAAEVKHERFSGHSRRVAKISKLIGERLYLSDSEVDDIYITGLLHDIGKLGFADNSLEYYFDSEFHGEMGRRMIEDVGFADEILEGIEYHHSNYGSKNSNREQPYYAQIIRLANDFDQYMTYNKGEISKDYFDEKIAVQSGKAYSPQFLKILQDIIVNTPDSLNSIYK